jgi:hypothetical protein
MNPDDPCANADDPDDCRDSRRQWRETMHHGLRRGIDVVADHLMSGDAGAAAAEAASGAPSAASGISAALDALPEVLPAAALRRGGATGSKAERYARARHELEGILARLKKHLGAVDGKEAHHHAGRPKRRNAGGAAGEPISREQLRAETEGSPHARVR